MSLPLLLAAAEVSSDPSIIEKFGIEPKYVLLQAISFLILFVVLYWKGIKPTIAAMDERKSKVEAGMKYAKEMEAKLAAAQIETATLIKNAQTEATKIIESARVTAKEFLEKQTQEATQKANDLIVKGQQSIELEHRKMLAEARTEIATLVVKTTERVLAKQLSDADRSRYNEAAARELTLV